MLPEMVIVKLTNGATMSLHVQWKRIDYRIEKFGANEDRYQGEDLVWQKENFRFGH